MRTALILFLAASSALAQETIFARFIPAAGGGANTWSFIQSKNFDQGGSGTGGSACSSATTACTVTVSSTGSGNYLAVATITGNNTTVNSPTASTSQGTWTHCASCSTFNSGAGHADVWYVASSTSGATTVTCNTNTADGAYIGCAAVEYSYTPGPATVDNSNNSTNASCTTCAAPSLSITGTKDVCIQLLVPGGSVSAISGSYTNPANFPGNNFGIAGAINVTSYSAPNWTTTSGNAAMSVLCFK